MVFNSYEFIFGFVPAVLLGFIVLKRTRSVFLVTAWLLACSIFFYGYWKVEYVALLVISILTNYGLGIILSGESPSPPKQKRILIFGITFNLGLISYFKYYDFFIESIQNTTGFTVERIDVALPLAISFFTFQQIAYLVDVYRSRRGERSLLRYALFVCFFPQLIAGPIVHFSEVIPQFLKRFQRPFLWTDVAVGLFIFSVGLFKKVAIADQLAIDADAVFLGASRGIDLTVFEAWLGALSYTFQIYFDFSGYSDMAIGLARLFGIRLPMNFASPYKATSIIEFWQRWHMTLSRFLRDYLYIPLGGNRLGTGRRYTNVAVTMLLGGLWHGAGWTFVIWGGVHGALIIINHLWRSWGFAAVGGTATSVAGWLLTFIAVVFAWTFFRADHLEGALTIQQAMLLANGISLPDGLGLGSEAIILWSAEAVRFDGMFHNGLVSNHIKTSLLILASFLICLTLPNAQQLTMHFRPVIDTQRLKAWQGAIRISWRPTPSWAACTGVLLAVGVLYLSSAKEFLYFQF